MSDKEPRRRKKRKDSQPPRKEDVHTADDHFFTPSKSEGKDSDQELEEEIVIPTHQPSVFAKFIFVLLFSGLVVSLSFIFISLHGTDRGEVDIFNGHSEEIEVPHDDLDFHDHDEETSEEESIQENIADYFPSIGSILSFNDEHSKEPVEESISDSAEERELSDEQLSELPVPSSTDEYVSSTIQASIEDYAEDTDQSIEMPVSSKMDTDTLEEPESVSFQSDISYDEISSTQESEIFPEHKPEVDELDREEISENVVEYSDSYNYVTEAEPPESITESYTSSVNEDILPTTFEAESKDEQPFDQDDTDDFIDTSSENAIEEEVTYYEKKSITNEEDFKIREELDELDEILQKEFNVHDNDDDDEEDDDEYDDDEGTRDEFDFWQF